MTMSTHLACEQTILNCRYFFKKQPQLLMQLKNLGNERHVILFPHTYLPETSAETTFVDPGKKYENHEGPVRVYFLYELIITAERNNRVVCFF